MKVKETNLLNYIMYTNTRRNGKKEMTLESEKIRAIPMVHWCQWRPFLSPLTPVESICEYWTTLARNQAVYSQIARGYHVQQHPNIPTTHSSGLFHLIKDKGRYVLPDVLLIYLACFISSRHKERDVLHILISRLFRLIIA